MPPDARGDEQRSTRRDRRERSPRHLRRRPGMSGVIGWMHAVAGECGGDNGREYEAEIDEERDPSANPDLWLYRERTMGLLKRYLRLSMETGRLSSLLGREFFRNQVTPYHVSTFEEVVIFVHDVERSLEKLDRFGQELIAVIVFEEFSQPEAAKILHCGVRTVERYFPETVDQLSTIFLEGGILRDR